MEHRFLSQNRSGEGKGVKEKNLNRNKMNTSSGIGVSTELDVTLSEDTPAGVASVVQECVTLSVVDMMVEMEMISSLEDTSALGSFPPLSTLVTTTAGNAPGKSSYANVTGKPSEKKVNFHTLFTPEGNGIDVVVLVESIRAISERFANTTYGFLLGKRVTYPVVANYVKLHGVPVTAFSEDVLGAIATKLGTPLMLDSYTSYMCMQSWGRSNYARAMIELRADMELKDNIVVAMSKITREGHYTCVGETKNMKKTSQAPKGITVGPKVGFKPTKEYKPAPKKHTANSSGNKKKGVDSTNKVSDSNPFEFLNSFDNDVEMGTNGGTSNLDNNRANSSGSSFWNVENSSTSTTPIMDKIRKFENIVINGQAILVDEAGNPLKKLEYPGDHDSEDEVTSVDNDMARDLDSERSGFGTQSLLEQWRDSYGNGDYDEDPYNDDMYEGQDLSEEIQTICDKLDI
ncbi:hypothetical protein Tco_1439251 [Tanacetum coccineum]